MKPEQRAEHCGFIVKLGGGVLKGKLFNGFDNKTMMIKM
jgi:hypothetical protein